MTIKVKMTGSKNAAYYGVCENDVVKLELREYLVGVVAAEIGNSSLEACKAQAVASRTMAYPYYSAGRVISDSSKSVQCFNAERAHSDKYPLAVQAVKETEGEILSYQGNVVVPCSFSSDNGGKTVSSEKQWGGKRAWLIEQDDPWDAAATGGKKTGHGVGMSQAGAKYAAGVLGKSYAEILSFYYQGTVLTREGESMSVKASYLVEKFKTMVLPWCSPNSPWKYVAGGTSKGAVDCSGAFTYWYKQAGGTMYHGSNTMWRKYTTVKGKIGEIDLVPGMAVFKMRQDGQEPSAYKNDGEGNFYHVGLYIGDNLVVEAQGTKAGCVTSKLSTWKYAARLTGTEYDLTEGESTVASTATVVTTGGSLNMRASANKSASILLRIPNGKTVTVASQSGDWYCVTYGGKTGYVMGEYLSFGEAVYTMTGTTTSETVKNQIVEYAKGLGVTLTVTGGDE